MHIGPRLQEFIASLPETASIAALLERVQDATRDFGYDCFALVQHVDLSGPLDDVVALSTYEADWVMRLIARRYFRFDPVTAASHRYGTAFGWDRIPEIIRLTKRQYAVLREAQRFGIVDGLTVPLHFAGEWPASCTFARAHRKPVLPNDLGVADLIARFAYQRALELVRKQSPSGAPKLTDRAIDCLMLSAAGNAQPAIANLLGVSVSTVHYHLSGAMRRYGVHGQQQLMLHALRDGLISFVNVPTF